MDLPMRTRLLRPRESVITVREPSADDTSSLKSHFPFSPMFSGFAGVCALGWAGGVFPLFPAVIMASSTFCGTP